MTADPIDTDVIAEWVSVDTADGLMRVYRATSPGAPSRRCAVVVLQEAFGVNDHIQDVSRRFAAQGYLALAPDLFHRTGVGIIDYSRHQAAMAQIDALGVDEIDIDLAAVVGHLAGAEAVELSKVGVVGFCFGGRAAFTAATHFPDLAGTVVFYGPGVAAGPHSVLHRVAHGMGPVLLIIGDQDPTIPREHIESIRSACAHAGVDVRIAVFAGAGHAFHCDARPGQFRADDARTAWQDTLSFLAEVFG